MSSRLVWRQPLNFFRNNRSFNNNRIRRYAQETTQNPVTGGSNGIRPSIAIGSTLAFSFVGYALGSLYPPDLATYIHPRPSQPPPSPNTAEYIGITNQLEKDLQSIPLLQSLRSAPDASEWYEIRPYTRFSPEKRMNSMTAGALSGVGRMAISPLVRVRRDESESYVFIHVGRGLCGHDGIVHGGLIATILDEAMGRVALLNFPTNIGVTANLSVNYRAPTKADQFIVAKVKLTKKDGRKSWIESKIETLDGTVMADATALFIEPKYAKLLSSSAVRHSLGAPEKLSITPDVKGAGGSI